MDSPPVIGIISPGAMGAAIAKRLSASGCRVLSSLSSRSERTRQRAQESGMEDASLATIIREARWLLSIVPPDSAEPFVREYLQILLEASSEHGARSDSDKPFTPPIFVDCNAKSPETTKRLASIFSSNYPDDIKPFLNACIIGLPPLGDHNPTFYASAEQDPTSQRALEEFGALSRYGIKVTFSGIMKGMIAIYETMILSAHAHSPLVANALLKEMQTSLAFHSAFIDKYVQQSYSKSYRFIHEMQEMAGFLNENIPFDARTFILPSETSSQPPPRMVSQTFHGFAALYGRISQSYTGNSTPRDLDGSSDIAVLDDFVCRTGFRDL